MEGLWSMVIVGIVLSMAFSEPKRRVKKRKGKDD